VDGPRVAQVVAREAPEEEPENNVRDERPPEG
jgi:hypothetical protein